jgi:hypothetical protein
MWYDDFKRLFFKKEEDECQRILIPVRLSEPHPMRLSCAFHKTVIQEVTNLQIWMGVTIYLGMYCNWYIMYVCFHSYGCLTVIVILVSCWNGCRVLYTLNTRASYGHFLDTVLCYSGEYNKMISQSGVQARIWFRNGVWPITCKTGIPDSQVFNAWL